MAELPDYIEFNASGFRCHECDLGFELSTPDAAQLMARGHIAREHSLFQGSEITIRYRQYGKGRRYRLDLQDGYLEATSHAFIDSAVRRAVDGGATITDLTGEFGHLAGGDSRG